MKWNDLEFASRGRWGAWMHYVIFFSFSFKCLMFYLWGKIFKKQALFVFVFVFFSKFGNDAWLSWCDNDFQNLFLSSFWKKNIFFLFFLMPLFMSLSRDCFKVFSNCPLVELNLLKHFYQIFPLSAFAKLRLALMRTCIHTFCPFCFTIHARMWCPLAFCYVRYPSSLLFYFGFPLFFLS